MRVLFVRLPTGGGVFPPVEGSSPEINHASVSLFIRARGSSTRRIT